MKRNLTITILLAVLAAVLVGQGTYAYFSDSSSGEVQSFAAGTLSLNDPLAMGSWSADITNMAPGDTRTATVTIQNTGSLPLQFRARVVTSGALFGGATPATAAIDCGAAPTNLAAGASQVCNVTVSFPAEANNDYQGATGALRVDAEAHQVGSTDSWWGAPNPKVAFQSNRDGNYEIYAMNADGSGAVNLTNNSASDSSPAWSPDGSKIAFTSNRDGNNEIYVMNADGSGPVNLTNNSASDSNPAWSPDGTRIAFTSSRSGKSEVWMMNADGSSPMQLTTTETTRISSMPDWSPDGAKIAFISNRQGGGSDIWVMNADGTNQTRLLYTISAPEGTPRWSPDGTRIAFIRYYSGGYVDIWVMNSDGTGETQLTNTGSGINPEWTADGSKVVYSAKPEGNYQVYIIGADGTGQTRLTDNPATDAEPSWLQP